MIEFFKLLLLVIKSFIKTKSSLTLEITLLRHQLNVYQRTKKPIFKNPDCILWVLASKVWNNWKSALVIVKPETVIRWHRKGFKMYWRWKSRKTGRPNIDWELIKLIRRMNKENPLWSAQRIQGELVKLGYDICDNTVAR